MAVVVKVYDRDSPTTLLGTLTGDRARQWLDQLNDVGSWALSIPKGHADAALFGGYNTIVRFELNGSVVFAGLEERPTRASRDQAEEAGQLLGVSGRSVLAILGDGFVLPEGGLGARWFRPDANTDARDTRRFDWTSAAFDDSVWPTATRIKRQGDTTSASPPAGLVPNQYDGAPTAWPNPDTDWIASRDQDYPADDPLMPVGEWLARQDFSLSDDTPVVAFGTADDGIVEGILDGAPFIAESGEFMWQQAKPFPILLKAGSHQLAFRVVNFDRNGATATNATSLLFTIMATDSGGNITTPLGVDTSDAWKVLDFPAVLPGMTPGQILKIVIDEAQALGYLTGVTYDFDEALDSDGNAWPAEHAVSYAVGTSILQVVENLVEIGAIDVAMSPTLVLSAWPQGGKGTASGAVLDAAVTSLTHGGEGPVTTAPLVRNAEGLYQIVEDAAAVAAYGKRGGLLQLPSAASISAANEQALAILVTQAHPKDTVTCTVVATGGGNDPYADFVTGDTADVDDNTDTPVTTRVLAIAMAEVDPSADGAVGGTQQFTIQFLQVA